MLRVSILALSLLVVTACADGSSGDDGGVPLRPTTTMFDVSLVWPLPTALDDLDAQSFLAAPSVGGHGVLLPRAVFDALEPLTRVDEPDDLYASLVVVGARLDPCFQEGTGAPPCQRNVRLVLQPVRPPVGATTGALVARDAAVHVFYPADDDDELLDAVAALARLRDDAGHAGDGALGVHPLLTSRDGRASVVEVLAPLLGADRLSRATFVGVHGDDAAWTFGGFDVGPGLALTAIVIPETGGETEQHLLSDGGEGPIHASVLPVIASADDITVLLDDAAASAATPAERQAAFDAAARIENPTLHNPGTVDCVSCHMTAVARVSALAREALAASPDAYTSTTFDLTPTTAFSNTQVTRAFGYRATTLALAPRVVHESAAVATLVESLLADRE